MRLSLVIVTLRRAEHLDETLTSIRGCDPLPDEILVVDGDPGQSARPVVERHQPLVGTPLRYESGPTGTSPQRNRGMELATGDVVVFFDDDVRPRSDVIARLASAYEESDVVGATGRVEETWTRRVGSPRSRLYRLLPGREGGMTAFGYPRRIVDVDTPRDMDFMHGCLMSVRRDVGLAVRFDEALEGYGLAEDEDFGYRVSRIGRVRYVPEAVVHHLSQGVLSASRRQFDRKLVVHRTYLFRKSFPRTPVTRAQFAALVGMLVAHRLVNREWSGARGLLEGAWLAWRSGRGDAHPGRRLPAR